MIYQQFLRYKLSMILILYTFSGVAVADFSCNSVMKEYGKKFIALNLAGKSQLKERLSFLESVKKECNGNSLHAMKYADVLVLLGEAEEALMFLDYSLTKSFDFPGNIIYKKGMISLISKKHNKGLNTYPSWREIHDLFIESMKKRNTLGHLSHLGLVESSIEMKEYDAALFYIDKGMMLTKDTEPRFLNLAVIAEVGKAEYKKAITYLEESVKRYGSKNYFNEPDTVKAAIMALCKMEEIEVARNILVSAKNTVKNLGQVLHPDYLDSTVIIERECLKKIDK
jgi:tetratricopeptide (TPR) repeat protein